MRLCALALAALAARCAHTVGEVAGKAAATAATVGASSGLHEALLTLNRPEDRELLQRLLDTPEIRHIAHDIGLGITEGALEGLGLQAATATTGGAAAGQLGRTLGRRVTPLVVGFAAQVVEAAIAQASSARNRERVALLLSEATDAALREASASLQSQLGPAMRRTVVEDVAPAIADALNGPAGAAIASTSYAVGRSATRGASDALLGPDQGALPRLEHELDRWLKLAALVVLLVGAALIALTAAIASLLARDRSPLGSMKLRPGDSPLRR